MLLWAKFGRSVPWPARAASETDAAGDRSQLDSQRERARAQAARRLRVDLGKDASADGPEANGSREPTDADLGLLLVRFFADDSFAYCATDKCALYGGAFTGAREVGVSLPTLAADPKTGTPALRVPARFADAAHRRACELADAEWERMHGTGKGKAAAGKPLETASASASSSAASVAAPGTKTAEDSSGVTSALLGAGESADQPLPKQGNGGHKQQQQQQQQQQQGGASDAASQRRKTGGKPAAATAQSPGNNTITSTTTGSGKRGKTQPLLGAAEIRECIAAAKQALRGAAVSGQPPVPSAHRKLFLPLAKFPKGFDVGAHLAGENGSQLRRLETDTGCKILLRGKGSVAESSSPLLLFEKSTQSHLGQSQPMHLVIDNFHARADVALRAVAQTQGIIETMLGVELSSERPPSGSSSSTSSSSSSSSSSSAGGNSKANSQASSKAGSKAGSEKVAAPEAAAPRESTATATTNTTNTTTANKRSRSRSPSSPARPREKKRARVDSAAAAASESSSSSDPSNLGASANKTGPGERGEGRRIGAAAGSLDGQMLRVVEALRAHPLCRHYEVVVREVSLSKDTREVGVTLSAQVPLADALLTSSARQAVARAALTGTLPLLADLCGGVACMLNSFRSEARKAQGQLVQQGQGELGLGLLPPTESLHVRHVADFPRAERNQDLRQEVIIRTIPGSFARLGQDPVIFSVDVECVLRTCAGGVGDLGVTLAKVQVRKRSGGET
jgi:hypothetical protein